MLEVPSRSRHSTEDLSGGIALVLPGEGPMEGPPQSGDPLGVPMGLPLGVPLGLPLGLLVLINRSYTDSSPPTSTDSTDPTSTDSTDSNVSEGKKGGFLRAYEKFEDILKPPPPKVEPVKPPQAFKTLLRNSKLMELGDPKGKVVIGKIVHLSMAVVIKLELT
ncbi:unnamed protein product [Cyprideis torosa]|uniref:Uncharacterized protein n=1 Tax=Cyprideis torosa TaxID=163714 RepID=A0A7R8ZQA8_9CRUS|nr:unnamed protein product [Cyprideis torosa]CAG0891655.1 unnamed protein product [Cyprideis torosa]